MSHRIVLIFKGLSGGTEGDSVLRELGGVWPVLLERAQVGVLQTHQDVLTPEVAYFGISPVRFPVAAGPLMVSALGVDPPDRSVHFHLSWLSVDEAGQLGFAPGKVSAQELDALNQVFEQLQTKRLIPVLGEGTDHALVWEDGSLDLGVTAPSQAAGQPWDSCLPEGDGERILRQLIEDSLNILDDHEINRIRREEGEPPLNVLWPWGFGFRPSLPNLALRRGEVVEVRSNSLRLQGLARLVGYRHSERSRFLKGVHVNPKVLKDTFNSSSNQIVVLNLEEMRQQNRMEEIEYSLRVVGENLVEPILSQPEPEHEILILAPGNPGLFAFCASYAIAESNLPFDERILDEPKAPKRRMEELIDQFLTPKTTG
ncbi:MAG: hypothetical protein KDC26_08740 [Armatimonadetes bacterium]|nr:hypothetical protein [Armatimonadota bacterium]